MNQYFDYEPNIRADLPAAYRRVWETISKPGFWLTGEEKIAIVQAYRDALQCEFCVERKSALSPTHCESTHLCSTNLPEKYVDTIHRIVTDASRLSKGWLDGLYTEDFTDGHYVELLGVVVAAISIDTFHLGMGYEFEQLPVAQPGEPSYRRPTNAKFAGAWVPVVMPGELDAEDADLYNGAKETGNVLSAMSLVPDAVRVLMDLGAAQYLTPAQVPDPSNNGGRAIDRMQIEFLASRVSSHNECFY